MVCFSPIPQPLTPSGGKGGLNSQFGGVTPAGLLRLSAWCGFAQTVSGGGAHPMRALRAGSTTDLEARLPGRDPACHLIQTHLCEAERLPPIPQPLTPGGGKGSFNSQFGFVASAGLLRSGAWCGFAQTIAGGGAHPMRALWARSTADLEAACPRARCLRQQASARGEVGPPRHSGRAEQRSARRIRAGACLSEASLRPTPPCASSARNPAGARSAARLFFGYFLLAKQKKVTRLPGRTPACHEIQQYKHPAGPEPAAYLFFTHFPLPKKKRATRLPGRTPARHVVQPSD